MKFFIIIMLSLAMMQPCVARELYRSEIFTSSATDIYSTLSNLENQLYGKDYSNDNVETRIDRLETSLYSAKSRGAFQARINRIMASINSAKKHALDIKEQVILELLENRYFGRNYKNDKFENRLTRLENIILGMPFLGDSEYRFNNLVKKVPLSIIGITITDNSGNKVSIKPEIKDQEYYSPLGADYSGKEGDYFNNISRTSDNKVSRWRDFPVYVYIGKSVDEDTIKSAQKAVGEWSKFIQLEPTNDIKTANIIIKWYASIDDAEGSIRISYDKVNPQIIINGNYCQNTDNLYRFLMHEIGHAIGLWGHSNNPDDIMYSFKDIGPDIFPHDDASGKSVYIKSAPDRPSVRDIDTLIRIYGSSGE